MTSEKDEFAAKLEAISLAYLNESFCEQVQDVRDSAETLFNLGESEKVLETLIPLHAASHKLAGSSGTFGLSEASAAARLLSNFTDSNGPVTEDNYEQRKETIRSMVADIVKIADATKTN